MVTFSATGRFLAHPGLSVTSLPGFSPRLGRGNPKGVNISVMTDSEWGDISGLSSYLALLSRPELVVLYQPSGGCPALAGRNYQIS